MTKETKLAPAERAAKERLLATLEVLSPQANAAAVAEEFAKSVSGEIDAGAFSELLRQRIARGDSTRTSEETLLSQAVALDVLFASLARRAALNLGEYVEAGDTYLRLALRAQNQCRMTLETLAAIKNPPVVFAKQANIAHGHQQVNNGMAVAPAQQIKKAPTELLEHDHGERLDTRTATAAGGSDPAMATVVEIHRSAQRRGQDRVQP